MADEPEIAPLEAAFPAPPPFWQQFTARNLERVREIEAEAAAKKEKENGEDMDTEEDGEEGGTGARGPGLQAMDLPPELRALIPPQPPADGVYRCFGEVVNLSSTGPTLKETGLEQLYPSPPTSPTAEASDDKDHWTLPHTHHLLKLVRSLLLNYLEYVGILALSPQHFLAKFSDLETLVLNCHSLINLYRPHQARASLIGMMEEQLERKREEVEGVRRAGVRVAEVLEGLGKVEGAEKVGVGEEEGKEEERKRVQRDVWRAMGEELGED
ncbi:hypothetical protein K490DRAFT_33027 [Saccharata proteae CBS 121410]|uniref:Mediator of RNA polymerase II transcription subunit 7 n=1 Tax=Saccharata proteae CBS 121410 TaxID=1314787 RepID=A0A9P4HY19_9PEZI|nr:hypothetical protein K490DRAFT_33027 [Saccharata proteae CBS 121410]